MTDILIRNVPPDVVAAIDNQARRLGLSRAEYLKRRLIRDAARPVTSVTVDDLEWFADSFADLDNSDIMAKAWD